MPHGAARHSLMQNHSGGDPSVRNNKFPLPHLVGFWFPSLTSDCSVRNNKFPFHWLIGFKHQLANFPLIHLLGFWFQSLSSDMDPAC